jgi:hypothetical protein
MPIICVALNLIYNLFPPVTLYRHEVVGTVLQLLGLLAAPEFRSAVRWLLSYANSARPAGRLVGLQLLGRLLTDGHALTAYQQEEERESDEEEEEEVVEGAEDLPRPVRCRRRRSGEMRDILKEIVD